MKEKKQVCLFCQETSHAVLVRATDIRVSDDGICGSCVAQAVRSLSDHGDWGKFR